MIVKTERHLNRKQIMILSRYLVSILSDLGFYIVIVYTLQLSNYNI